jgi:hypothetical protein
MRRIIAGTLALTVLSSTWLLGSEGATKAKKPVKKAPPPATAQLQQMQDQLNQQQQQINQLQQQLQQSNSQLQSTQSQLQGSVQQANQQAAAAQQAASAAQQTANSLNSSVVDLKTSTTTINQSLTVVQKDVKELLNPMAIRYKGVTITPVGFADGGFAWRNHNTNSSLSTPAGNIPLEGTLNTHFSETRFDARNSRLGIRVVGNPNDKVKLTGYFLGDFYGTADPATNAGQVNSWLFRIREAYAMAQLSNGFAVAGGQFYSLWTPGRKGVLPDSMMLPLAYEGNEIIGIPYQRGLNLRFTKKINANVSFGFELEQPELTAVTSPYTPSSLVGTENSGTDFPIGNNLPVPCCSQSFLVYPAGVAQVGGTAATVATPVTALQSINGGLSNNVAPDLAFRLAWDSTKSTAHFEVRGLTRFFRTGVALAPNGAPINTGASGETSIVAVSGLTSYGNKTGAAVAASQLGSVATTTATAYGIGISAVLPVTKKVDFVLTADAGAGVGSRYNPGSANSADATIKLNSAGLYTLQPVKSTAELVGFELHPTPKWDWYLYVGNEYYQRVNYSDSVHNLPLNAALGLGGANQSCGGAMCLGYANSNITSITSQTSPNRDVWEGTVGYIYKFWSGPYGTFQTMGEYQYYHRAVWQTAFAGPEPLKGNMQMIDLAMRYVLP